MSESPIKGGEDWVLVLSHETGAGYEWSRMDVYYSPSARRHFWYSDSGCSCNYFDVGWATEFSDGDREAVCRAFRTFAEEDSFTSTAEAFQSMNTLKTFKEPK